MKAVREQENQHGIDIWYAVWDEGFDAGGITAGGLFKRSGILLQLCDIVSWKWETLRGSPKILVYSFVFIYQLYSVILSSL
jgi:hypothetical protein